MAEKQEIQESKYELRVPKSAEGGVPELQPTRYPLKVPVTPTSEGEPTKETPKKSTSRKSSKK